MTSESEPADFAQIPRQARDMLALSRTRAGVLRGTGPASFSRSISGTINVHRLPHSQSRPRDADAALGVRRYMQSILHGSPEAKAAGEVETQQHTRLVARGKYVHAFEGLPQLSIHCSKF